VESAVIIDLLNLNRYVQTIENGQRSRLAIFLFGWGQRIGTGQPAE